MPVARAERPRSRHDSLVVIAAPKNQLWINKPAAALADRKRDFVPEVVTNFAFNAPYSDATAATHTQVSPHIGIREPLEAVASEVATAVGAPLNREDLH